MQRMPTALLRRTQKSAALFNFPSTSSASINHQSTHRRCKSRNSTLPSGWHTRFCSKSRAIRLSHSSCPFCSSCATRRRRRQSPIQILMAMTRVMATTMAWIGKMLMRPMMAPMMTTTMILRPATLTRPAMIHRATTTMTTMLMMMQHRQHPHHQRVRSDLGAARPAWPPCLALPRLRHRQCPDRLWWRRQVPAHLHRRPHQQLHLRRAPASCRPPRPSPPNTLPRRRPSSRPHPHRRQHRHRHQQAHPKTHQVENDDYRASCQRKFTGMR
jgi:hypothetical protein